MSSAEPRSISCAHSWRSSRCGAVTPRRFCSKQRDASSRSIPTWAAPPTELLLDGLAANFADGYAAAVPLVQKALSGLDDPHSVEEELRWLWMASVAAILVWDDARWDRLSDRFVQVTRDSGALIELPLALANRSFVLLRVGDLSGASAMVDEAETVVGATGSPLTPYGTLALAAYRGEEARGSALASVTAEEAAMRGEGIGVAVAAWAGAVLYNGLGNYEKALAAAERAATDASELGPGMWALVELVEAAARTGAMDRARDAVGKLAETTTRGDRPARSQPNAGGAGARRAVVRGVAAAPGQSYRGTPAPTGRVRHAE
jgi:hypothetical protein